MFLVRWIDTTGGGEGAGGGDARPDGGSWLGAWVGLVVGMGPGHGGLRVHTFSVLIFETHSIWWSISQGHGGPVRGGGTSSQQ